MSTGIQWTEETWNPVIGCTPVSSGCLNCYAATMANRLRSMPQAKDYHDRRVDLGEGSYFFRGKDGEGRISLRQLDPNAGRHDEPEIECGFACLMAEREILKRSHL
jgi:protein gp37